MSFWIKGSSTGQIDFSNDLAAILSASANSVATAAVNAAGTGYVVGDILTVAGGTANVTAQIEVVTIGGSGDITAVRIFNAGSYTVNPTLTANAVTGGTGSAATINLTVSSVGWTVDRDQVWDGGSEREVIAHGSGSGSDTIYVGWRTFQNVGNDYYNMELHGFTGYSSSLAHNEQPGASAGDHTAGDPQDQGSYLLLTSSSFNWWVNVNSYRIIITVKIGAAYFHAYLGWGNRFGTTSEYPYPLVISAPSIYHDVNAATSAKISSIVDPWIAGTSSLAVGTLIYSPGGGWELCCNRRGTSPYDDYCVVPTQRPQIAYSAPSAPEDRFMDVVGNREFNDIIYSISTGSGGVTNANLQTTGTNDDHLMLPCFAVRTLPTVAITVEFDEVRWCNNFGGVNSEDRFIESDGTVWRVFANGNRTDTYAYLAIKEAS
jgi:hypothetical protein